MHSKLLTFQADAGDLGSAIVGVAILVLLYLVVGILTGAVRARFGDVDVEEAVLEGLIWPYMWILALGWVTFAAFRSSISFLGGATAKERRLGAARAAHSGTDSGRVAAQAPERRDARAENETPPENT